MTRKDCSGRLDECGAMTMREYVDGDCPKCKPSHERTCVWTDHEDNEGKLIGWETECQDGFYPTVYGKYCTFCGGKVVEKCTE